MQTNWPGRAIEPRSFLVRGQRVILDADLAVLYGTSTKALNQAVKRNRERFPADFLLQLTADEKQDVVTNCDHLARLKYSPMLPFAFTERGAIMAASVLNTPRAMDISVYVVRTFIKLRTMLATHHQLAHQLAELERRVGGHDEGIRALVAAIRELMEPPPGETQGPGLAFERRNGGGAGQGAGGRRCSWRTGVDERGDGFSVRVPAVPGGF